jgi:hypothetical protein
MTKKLPKKVEDYLNKNTTFNMVGALNLNLLRVVTKTRLDSKELKKRIRARFRKEIVGKIEFM